MWAGTIDLRTGRVSYSAFDAMYYAFAAVEFLRRWTGISVPVGGGEYCDSAVPGSYAALEKAYKAMTIAAFTGRHPEIGQGMLDQGKVICGVQLLLERDLTEGIAQLGRFGGEDSLDATLSAVYDVGFGLHTSYLQNEHTLRNLRSCVWMPELMRRAGWNGPEAETELVNRAQQKVDGLIEDYRMPHGREEQLGAMRHVVDRARKELLAQ